MKKVCVFIYLLFVTITYAQDEPLDLPSVSPAWRLIIKYQDYSDSSLLNWVKETKSECPEYDGIVDSVLLLWAKGYVKGFDEGYDKAKIELGKSENQLTVTSIRETQQDLRGYYMAMRDDGKMLGEQLGAEYKHHDFAASFVDVLTECSDILFWTEDFIEI